MPGCAEIRSATIWLILVGFCWPLRSQESLSRYVDTPAGEATITIVANERAPFRIPRTIYGTFLEHIGQSVFGGVSAQLLDNPSLEPYPASPENIQQRLSAPVFRESTRLNLPLPWLPLRPAGRRYEPRMSNAANSTACLYIMGLPGREVGIRQSIYLPVERELAYRGVLFVSADSTSPVLSVSFRRHDRPDDILAESILRPPARRGWAKLSFELKMPSGAVAPLEPVDFALAVRDGSRFSVDEIRLYPMDAEGGLDPEIVEWAARLNSPLLRYGGNFSSGYHWKDGVGPLDSRPTRINEAWGIPEYNEFGTDELMKLCRRTGAHAQICLNLGSGSAEEARQWVEYCQGSRSSVQGRLRAANGHSQPYPVGAWEFGNELYDDTQLGWYKPEEFATQYLAFFRVVAPIVPPGTPLLATGGEIDAFEKWNGALIRSAGPSLYYLTTHLVADLEDTLSRSADRDTVIAADLALPVGVGRAIGSIRSQIEGNPGTRGRVKLAYTEWMFRSPTEAHLPDFDNMGGAVIAAAWLNMLARNADWIPIANMTGLMEFGGIHKRRGRTFVSPQFWSLYLFSKYAGDTVIGTETRVGHYDVHGGVRFAPEIPGVPYLDVLATVGAASGDISLVVVNRNPKQPQPASIRLKNFSAKSSVRVFTLAAPSLLAGNDEEHQATVQPVESRETLEGDTLRHTLPAGSVTLFLFSAAS